MSEILGMVALRLLDLAIETWQMSGKSQVEWDRAYDTQRSRGFSRDPSTLPPPPELPSED